MTQQNQPTLLEQARLTDGDILAIDDAIDPYAPLAIAENERHIADAATRKAFEVIEKQLRSTAGILSNPTYIHAYTDIADMLHAQIHSGEAQK